MQQQVKRDEFFREPRLSEPSPRKQLGLLPTQLARIRKFTFEPDQLQAIEAELVRHARRMAGEER